MRQTARGREEPGEASSVAAVTIPIGPSPHRCTCKGSSHQPDDERSNAAMQWGATNATTPLTTVVEQPTYITASAVTSGCTGSLSCAVTEVHNTIPRSTHDSTRKAAISHTPGHTHHPTHAGRRHGGHGDGVRGGEDLQANVTKLSHHQAHARHQGQS